VDPLKVLSILPGFLLVACSALTNVYADQATRSPDSSIENLLEQATTTVYCYCGCTRETIRHCVCGTAQQVEADFLHRLGLGVTVEQIRDEYIATHGTQYLAIMPAKGFNLVAYVVPALIIILLGLIVFGVIKSKVRSLRTDGPVSFQKGQCLTEDVRGQIEAELERVKQQG